MNIATLFLGRYDALYNFYLNGYWEVVPEALLRKRPFPQTNSIAWNIWHITRCEDAGLNRFVANRQQVLDEGDWMEKMNLPLRHHGSNMTLDEVEQLSQQVHLPALRAYSQAVQKRTRAVIAAIDEIDLSTVLEETQVRPIMTTEGLAHSQAEGFIKNYTGWSKGKCVMTFGLTHSFQHLGEMELLASLLGVSFD